MAGKFLDKTGLAYVWNKLKGYFLPKVGGTITGDLKVNGKMKRSPLTDTPADDDVPTVLWVKNSNIKGPAGATPEIKNGTWHIAGVDTKVPVSTPGPKGDTGPRGAQGPQGIPGPKGEQGLKGDTGAKGETGPRGSTGASGSNGITPTIGSNGNWFLGNSDTGKPSRGLKGDAGPKGATGATGPQGNTGVAGAAATITIGTVSTGAPGSNASVINVGTSNAAKFNFTIPRGATGSQGPKGDQGLKGDTGAKGEMGPKGATGSTGQRGSQWFSGIGITGTSTTSTVFTGSGVSNALIGDYYLNTATGYVYRCTVAGSASVAKWIYTGSIKGATGAKGPQGIQGPQGPRGEMGPQGQRGESGVNKVFIQTSAPTGAKKGDIWI